MKINEEKSTNRKTIHFECHNILYYYPALGFSIVRFSQFTYTIHCICVYELVCASVCFQSFLRCHDFSEQVDNQARTKNIKTTLMTFIIHCWTSERDLRAVYNKFSLCAWSMPFKTKNTEEQEEQIGTQEPTNTRTHTRSYIQTNMWHGRQCGMVGWCVLAMQSRANDFLFRLIESIVNASKRRAINKIESLAKDGQEHIAEKDIKYLAKMHSQNSISHKSAGQCCW